MVPKHPCHLPFLDTQEGLSSGPRDLSSLPLNNITLILAMSLSANQGQHEVFPGAHILKAIGPRPR